LVVHPRIAGIVFWRLRRRTPAEPISKELPRHLAHAALNLSTAPRGPRAGSTRCYALRVYLVVAVLLLLVKAIQIG